MQRRREEEERARRPPTPPPAEEAADITESHIHDSAARSALVMSWSSHGHVLPNTPPISN